MGTEMWTALSGVAVSVVTAVGTVWVAKAGRRTAEAGQRTAEQERRDSFATITDRMEREMVRQGQQINELKAESLRQGEQITDQALAIQWLQGRLREVVSFFRAVGPVPPASDPIPERAKKYIHHADV